jgi:bacteriorhodopsin
MNKYYFYTTLIFSFIVQIFSGLIDVATLFIKVEPAYDIIKQLLALEVFVQLIQGSFYLWLVCNYKEIHNVTPKRYIDWVITTPLMLISLIIYLIYLKYKESGLDTSKLKLFNLLRANSSTISYVIYLDWLMLIFGYLGETKIINTITGVVLGFIPFLIYFYIIYISYVSQTTTGWKLCLYFFFFWSLYGVSALLPHYIKNTFYNILDLFAKNFFGLFLSYIILSKSNLL